MRAKKSLGQNFLTSHATAGDIARALSISKNETALEIGPGKGILTEALLAQAPRVVAVEKDDELAEHLKEMFAPQISQGALKIITGDILEHAPQTLGLHARAYVVVANIPYYITGKILRYFLESDTPPRALALMVQKEVADRIIARDKKESLLSLSVKVFGTPRYVKKVPAQFFRPKPKVDSAIITIEYTPPSLSPKELEKFFILIKAGFAHKRKKLWSNLLAVCTQEELARMFSACAIDKNIRAEDVPLSAWQCLATHSMMVG